jgi:predicted MPP superfamily phosphohydrolase
MDFVFWLFVGLIAVGLWSLTWARWRFIVHHSEAAVLPKGSKDIRVLHISDIHMAPWQSRKQQFIANLIDLQPDLVVDTGDNLGHKDVIAITINSLESLLSVPGVFVNGSNDYYAPRFKSPIEYLFRPSTPKRENPLATTAMTDEFESRGWKNLNNRAATIEINGVKFGFIGVDDPHDELDDISSLNASAKTLGNVDVIVGVAHAPYRRVIEAMAAEGASIMFAGHTHGGQVRLPFIGALTTNSDLPNKHAKGLSAWAFEERVMLLNVVAGLGNSIFAPIRLFNRPEVRVITLTAQK